MRVSYVTVRKRLTIVFLTGILIFAIIDLRLGYVQFWLGDLLAERAKGLWGRNIPFEPKRGEILDRNGVPLATNMSAPTVYVIPRQVKNPAQAAEKLAQALGAPSNRSINKSRNQHRSSVSKKGGKFPMKRRRMCALSISMACILPKTRSAITRLAAICRMCSASPASTIKGSPGLSCIMIRS